MNTIFVALIGLVTAGIFALKAVAADVIIHERIAPVVQAYSDNKVFEGAVLVARGDQIVYSSGTGIANREWGTANGPDVHYRLASLTKGFTAVLVLKLAEEGKLQLTDTIQDHLPDYKGEGADVITLDQLVRHTSGMQHTTGLPGWFTGGFRRDINDAEFMQEIAKLPLLSKPGERYSYSNLDYFLLGKIVEKVTGQTYEEALKTRIFEPLEMADSGVDRASKILNKRADGYVWAVGGGFRNQGYNNMDVFGAGAALYSTTPDMLKWFRGLKGGKILGAKSLALMFEKDNAIGWRSQDWKLEDGRSLKTINYDGQIDGFSTYLTYFEESDVTVILLGNIGTGARAKARMTVDIRGALLENAAPAKALLVDLLTKSLVAGELEKGISAYRSAPENYATDESRLEAFGNEVGWAQMPHLSLKVRELTAGLFPGSVRAQVRLAETALGAGDQPRARQAYETALVLVPADDEALRAYLSKQLAKLAN